MDSYVLAILVYSVVVFVINMVLLFDIIIKSKQAYKELEDLKRQVFRLYSNREKFDIN
jgi:hypothetical protein